ncbi:hypothetical protein PAERUG_E16_London_17_VIM_2_04_14_01361 [Pseudomonas aeruginosa]|nr:hypothetical protein PAERUG_E16_London_17_VIM_2_04_14_01361 [Pseudomonas aeruginosa]
MFMSTPAWIARRVASRSLPARPCLISSFTAPWSLMVSPLKPHCWRNRSVSSQRLAVAGTPLMVFSETITAPAPASTAAL